MKKPIYRVVYLGKDITADMQNHVLSISYSDKVEGGADEVQILVDDVQGLWKNQWIPAKGDTLDVSIGYNDFVFPCGVFQVDELEMTGPPDVVNIKGLSTPLTKSLRTKRSYAHEEKKLSQIAEEVASRHGLTVQGVIDSDILIERRTQNRETDLGFLKRVSFEFGYVFSVRGSLLVFTSIFDLEASGSVAEIKKSDLISYRVLDTAANVYKSASVKYHDPNKNELINVSIGDTTGHETGESELVIFDKCENVGQAERKALSALHQANTRSQSGNISIIGNPNILAGVNFELVGLGRLSGVYHVTASTHTVSQSGGYETSAEIKKVGEINQSRW